MNNFESFSQNTAENSKETIKAEFQKKLHDTLYTPLTVDNIESFAYDALNEVIETIKEVVEKYDEETTTVGKEREDKAFAYFDLPNIEETLESIMEVKEEIDNLKTYIKEQGEETDEVLVPPQEGKTIVTGEGNGLESKKMFPRLLTLLYIIKHDFDIDITPEAVPILSGGVTDEMVRQTPYVKVEIGELNRLVYICDEEDNASYVFDTEKISEYGISISDLDVGDKAKINNLIAQHGDLGKRIMQTINWKANLKKCLENEFEVKIEKEQVTEDITTVPGSEFVPRKERKKWSYEKLRRDVLEKGIKSSTQYANATKGNYWPTIVTLIKIPEFPKTSDNSPDWDTFLERKSKTKWTYNTLRQDMLGKGIGSTRQYVKNRKKNRWPTFETLVKMPEFPKKQDGKPDWNTFFVKEGRRKWTYDTLRQDVLEKGIGSSWQYAENRKKNRWLTNETLSRLPELPRTPNGKPDWNKFFEREARQEWTYNTLRQDVLGKRVESSYQYTKKQKENRWPTFETLVKMPEFPKKQDGKPDWDTFFGRNI